MKTEVLKVDAESSEDAVTKAVDILKKGGIIAIPTETVYGLTVNADDKKAVDRLYSAKKRPEEKPFTIQIADLSQLKSYLDNIPAMLEIILKELWPGPLTVIVKDKFGFKLGLRMPDNKIALSIIKEAKCPLAVTSANISGKSDALSAEEVADIFNGIIDLIIDDGSKPSGVASTVLDCTVSPFKILRKGSASEKLERFLKLYG